MSLHSKSGDTERWVVSLGGVFQGPSVLPLCPHPTWSVFCMWLFSRPLFLPRGGPSLRQQRASPISRCMGPHSPLKGSCLMMASSLQPCLPFGASRGGSQGGGNERPIPFLWEVSSCLVSSVAGTAWLLFVLWIHCLEGRWKNQCSKQGPCGRSSVLNELFIEECKHRAFWKKKMFCIGSPRDPGCLPDGKLSTSQVCLTDICSSLH